MSVRFFVLSSSVMILSWLAVTFVLVVPLETYPPHPVADALKGGETSPVVAVASPAPVKVELGEEPR